MLSVSSFSHGTYQKSPEREFIHCFDLRPVISAHSVQYILNLIKQTLINDWLVLGLIDFGHEVRYLVLGNRVGSGFHRCPPTPPGIRLSYQGGFYRLEPVHAWTD